MSLSHTHLHFTTMHHSAPQCISLNCTLLYVFGLSGVRQLQRVTGTCHSLYSVLCTLYSVFCILYSVLCTLYSVLCTLKCITKTKNIGYCTLMDKCDTCNVCIFTSFAPNPKHILRHLVFTCFLLFFAERMSPA